MVETKGENKGCNCPHTKRNQRRIKEKNAIKNKERKNR